jgi:hypothetical protein
MSTPNGAGTIDPALLKAVHNHGYCIIVCDHEDAVRILDHGLPALNIPDVDLLTPEVMNPVTSLAILRRYGPQGEAFAEGVRLRLEDLAWQGTIKECPLPEDCPDLRTLAERYRGEPHRLSGFLLDLFAGREVQQLGAPKAEVRAGEDWGEPSPLPDGLPAVEPFEPKLLPAAFRPWIEDIAERMQCPPDFPAVAAIEAEPAVVGRRVGIRPKRYDDWLVVPNLWGGVVGRSGLLKTPAIQEPLRPLRQLEFDAGRDYEQAVQDWQTTQIIAKEREKVASAKIREALKKGQDGAPFAQALLEATNPPPSRRRYLVNDATVEKLGELLNENPHGLLVFRDELTGLLRRLDREGHESDRAFYLEAWNGTGRFVYDRIGRGTIEIEAACVSILGGIQPGPFAHYIRAALDGGVGDDGLIQRFQLLVWPDVSREWRNVDRWPDSAARQRAYQVFTRLNQLTSADINAACDEELGGIPYLRFAPEAQELFNAWRSELEQRLRRGDDHPALEAHLAKYRSLVPSLALLVHLADGQGNPVGVDALERACAWADYLESHARRVYSPMLARDYIAARALAAHILKGDLPNPFALKDVYRPQWSDLTTREEAQKAVDILLDLDWLRERAKEQTGGRPRQRFEINPRVKELAR